MRLLFIRLHCALGAVGSSPHKTYTTTGTGLIVKQGSRQPRPLTCGLNAWRLANISGYTCECIYVCMYIYVCMHACMLCMCMYVCTCMYVCMHACTCMYVCMHACMYVCVHPSRLLSSPLPQVPWSQSEKDAEVVYRYVRRNRDPPHEDICMSFGYRDCV